MNLKKYAKYLTVALAALLCVACLSACGNNGKVAATVNNEKIMEDDITKDIASYRAAYGLSDDETWAQYMSYYGYTPETIRETMIDSYVQRELVKKAAAENNITVPSEQIDSYVNSIKSNYENDEAWNNALKAAGLTEQQYRDNIQLALLEQQLMDSVCPLTEPSDQDVLNYAQMYASYSYNGARKSSHILFDSSDAETAQKVLDQLKSGSLKFEDAVAQYSKDAGSAADGGNVGWDCLSSFVTEYTTALKELEKDQLSGLVSSQFGIHIIKCTDVFNAPEELTSLDQVPSEMLSSVKSMVQTYNQQSDFEAWLNDYKEKSNVVINPMPKGLPYDVDMSAYASNTANEVTANTENTESNTAATENTSANTNAGSTN